MNLSRTKLFWISYFVVAVILQIIAGNFPFSFFKFPLNLILAILWIYGMWILYKDNKNYGISRIIMSSSATFITIVGVIIGSLVIGLFPQLSATDAESRAGILARLGVYNFMSSWVFVSILFALLTNLGMITIRAYFLRKKHRWRFLMNHVGLWLLLGGGFIGSSDLQTLRIPVFANEENNVSFSLEGEKVYLGYDLKLKDFESEHYENGTPRKFQATVSIIEGDNVKDVKLMVNHPYQKNIGEDIYLTGYDTTKESPEYCIVQIVKQPWKYVQLSGILMALIGAAGMFIGGPQKIMNKDDKLG